MREQYSGIPLQEPTEIQSTLPRWITLFHQKVPIKPPSYLSADSEMRERIREKDWSEVYYLVGQETIPDAEETGETWLAGYIPDDD